MAKIGYWRNRAKRTILQLQYKYPNAGPEELKKIFRDAWQGPTSGYPYQVWREEVRKVLGEDKPTTPDDVRLFWTKDHHQRG